MRVGSPPPIADRYQLREADRELAEALLSGRTVVLTGVERSAGVVLSGLGGIGKSQLAARHAWSVWRDPAVDVVVWIDATSREAILSRFAEVAGCLPVGDPTTGQRPPEDVARAVLEWMAVTDRRWLVVFDDLRDPADIRDLWPHHTPTGQVVATTRRQDAVLRREDRQVIELGVFSAQEAVAYLAGKLPGGAEPDELLGLASDLGFLPLALAQAGAFITDRPLLTIAEYRARCNDRRNSLAQVMPGEDELPDEHRATVAATWSLSIERADELEPQGLARPLLEVLSLLDPAGVPIALFQTDKVLRYLEIREDGPVGADEVADALGNLRRLGLVVLDRTRPDRTVQVHSLVQRVVRDDQEPLVLTCSAFAAAGSLLEIWPEGDTDVVLVQALRSSTDSLYANASPHLWQDPGPHPLALTAARSLHKDGLLAAAVAYLTRFRDSAHARFGPDHPSALAARAELAICRGESGDLAGAIADLEELVADRSRLFEYDDHNTLAVRGTLAYWRMEAGELGKAIDEHEELVTALIRVRGEDHPHTVVAQHNLALTHCRAGRLVEALTGLTSVRDHWMRVYGPDHPFTLGVRNDMIHIRAMAGEVGGVIDDGRQLLADFLRVLGADSRLTMVTRNNLACALDESGDIEGAFAEHRQLLADRVRVLGADHPDTLLTRGHLVHLKADSGDLPGAIADCHELLADRVRILGPDHPSTFSARNSLASFSDRSGDPGTAVTEYGRLLADQVRVLGPDYPDTLSTRSNLIVARSQTGALAESVAEYRRLVADSERVLGPEHPNTLARRHNLYDMTARSGDVVVAIIFYEVLLRDCLRVLGSGHRVTDAVTDGLMRWEAVLERGDHRPAPGSLDSAIVAVSYSGGLIVRGKPDE